MPLTAESVLAPGDVMLRKFAGTKIHVGITIGQALNIGKPGSATTVHAAICIDPGANVLAEAAGPGLVYDHYNLDTERWIAFRYRNTNIRDLVIMVAESYVAEKAMGMRAGNYSVPMAVKSVFGSKDFGAAAQQATDHLWGTNPDEAQCKFFCSNYAVRCYLAAGAAAEPPVVPINLDFRKTTPRDLEGYLANSADWREVPDEGPILWN
jgi:hypothetical protein